jgi:ubiquinone/menaquinone biosynthesis C-methylase UbiE
VSIQATQQQTGDMPPQMALMMMMTGYWVSQSIYVAAQLGLADLLKDGARTADELAESTGTHAPTLYRLLRALSSVGIFAEDENNRFSLTPLATALQTGPGSLRAMILHLGESPSWHAWGELLHSVRTGETAFIHAHGMEVFPFYANAPESSEPFNQAMTEYSEVVAAAVTKGYDFSQFNKVVDVGGGHAGLITAILKANPKVSGVVFDIGQVIEGGRARIESEGLADRCEAVAGDFFASVPEGGDAYVLKTIIHDWDDERAVAILKNIYEAMKADGKLLIIETVIPKGNEPSLSKLGDLHMLVMTGGCERTEDGYRALLRSAGFELTRVVPTESPMSIVEAIKKNQ